MSGSRPDALRRVIARCIVLAIALGAMHAIAVATPEAEAARLRVSPVRNGVVVRLVGTRHRRVAFALSGRSLARLRRPPYRVRLQGLRPAVRGHRGSRLRLVVRDARSGRWLAAVALARVRTPQGRQPVRITAGPADPSTSGEATFTFSPSGSANCSVDGAAFAGCKSPVTLRDLSAGRHSFRVRASGVTSSWAWSVLSSEPVPPPPPAPPPPPPSPPPPPPPPPAPAADPPAAPAAYAVPADARRVSNAAELITALGSTAPSTIVLEDGVYDNAAPFVNAWGHRVYAASLGRAVLKAGMVMGGNWGPGRGLIRGLAFDVENPAKTLHGSIVHIWGTGRGTHVEDVTFDGHGVLSAGVMVRQPEGFVARRVVARRFLDWGVIVDANVLGLTVSEPPVVEDLVVTDVSRPVPQASGGSSEACLWIGNTAIVRRVYAARCAWEAVWSGTASRGSLIEHVRVDESETGIYAEHYNSAGTTFRRLHMSPSVKRGVNCEWIDPAWNGMPGCSDVLIEDSLFETTVVGVYLDEGTTRTRVQRCVFRNQRWAAIGNHKGVENGFADNDYSGLAAGGVAVSPDHLSASWR